jgi:glycosyltransferase involved in cell wall biosynthesis
MRILVANKFWYRRGGLERVMFDEIRWLEDDGHEIAHFSTAHPDNEPSPWSSYFTPYIELGEGGSLSASDRARAAARLFSNREAARRFDRLVEEFRPDVVHVHGIHRQLSPSILAVARRHGVPAVQTLHDYHHVCPADVLLRADGSVCDPRRCGRAWYGAAVGGRCVRGSLGASALSAGETGWQRLTRAYERGIARFISPSRFMAERMAEGGWTVPIDVVPNAIDAVEARNGAGSGFVVIGRLAREKGVDVALRAAGKAGVTMRVAGEGPLGPKLRQEYGDAPFLGRLDSDEVDSLVREARAAVVPSLWFENAPMSVLETMAAGVPVIASRTGGIPEQVTDGLDGLLVAPGDIDGFAAAMLRLHDDEALAMRLGIEARRTAQTRFSPEAHVRGLVASYVAAGAEGRGAA